MLALAICRSHPVPSKKSSTEPGARARRPSSLLPGFQAQEDCSSDSTSQPVDAITEPVELCFSLGTGRSWLCFEKRSYATNLRRLGPMARKGAVRQKVKPFIQNIHHFRDEGVRTSRAPDDHIVIFDEAQRAWDKTQTASFMKRRKGIPDFDHSEPAFLISYLDRHAEWAAIVCLVGGGQEIHTGEAGISEWLNALADGFPHWQTYVSPDLVGSEDAAGKSLKDMRKPRERQRRRPPAPLDLDALVSL